MSERLSIRNPRNGEYDYEIVATTAREIASITSRMRVAQKLWREKGLEYRVSVLEKLKTAVAGRREELVNALSTDTGRLYISVAEVDGIASAIDRWTAVARAQTAPETKNSKAMPFIEFRSEKEPYPVAGAISPWNFPMTLSMIDALPAMLSGGTAIIKPSEVTPRFAGPMRRAVAEVEELKDILHIVDGDASTGAALIDHVDIVCFTGSVATGRMVAESAARNFIPSILELGGKDPAIVLEDADVERAATSLLRASIVNTGHACQSIERIYVHQSHFDDFVEKIVAKAQNVKFNYPDIHSGHIGPIIFEKQADIIKTQLAAAVSKGATVHTGGEIEHHGGGLWCRPTVLTNVNHKMTIMQDETFGPIMPIMAFESDDEAISLANDTIFGLSGSVYSENIEHANEIAMKIDAGGISINEGSLTGFMHEAEKNSFKYSGMGESRMGPAGYHRFFRKKAIMTNMGDAFPIEAFDEKNANFP
ncbi:MAG: aldehyde dehydrogenase family protein [Kordiimonadaceae bacterium]|jgi:succinate-semialdehyde dehydrogenase/glutarate-semialdehyde dehydrogenase|nr:aldehyde dehydrogenase family protein [Kordiimonadaceae bacterium]MBT6466102.1 aldehyde dehydrogenase family protein [Kordiimonadaceae bacterium]MBT7605697.1 aldehyde dehydrogenase family protein [Kordiimonadaceae bacterium]